MSLNSASHKKNPSSDNVGNADDQKSVSSKMHSRKSSTTNAAGVTSTKLQSSQKLQEPESQSLRETQS